MAAHRYWRAVSLEDYGAWGLELSAFYLLAAGTRVDTAATLTASAQPDISGTLANLQDGVLGTAAKWSGAEVKRLKLQWDFGASPVDVDDIRLAGDCEEDFLLCVAIEWSDDGVFWVPSVMTAGIKWPGAASTTTSSDAAVGAVERDDFTTNPAGKYQFLTGANVQGSATWSSSTTALRIQATDAFAYVNYTALPKLVPGGYVQANIRLLTDPQNRRHLGFFFATGTSTAVIGYRMSSLDSQLTMDVAPAVAGAAAVVTLGTLVTWRVDRTALGVFEVRLNGVLRATFSLSDVPALLGVGFYSYYGSIDVEDVEVGVVGTPGAIVTNKVKGRVAEDALARVGAGPAIVYGIPKITPLFYLGIESGSVKDSSTGVLGQGIGRVYGTVKRKLDPANIPLKRRVRLVREIDGLKIRETWSDAVTGAFDFQYVDELQKYTVLAHDYEHNYRAVIGDNITPELMPEVMS